MKAKHILVAWLVTVVIGSLLLFPGIDLLKYLRSGYASSGRWGLEELASSGIASAIFAFMASLPATIALLVALSIFKQKGMSRSAVLINVVKAQLIFAALTFGFLFATEGTDNMIVVAAAIYTPIGCISLVLLGWRSAAPAPGS